MTQLIVPSAGTQHSSRNAPTLKPGVVDIFLDFEADFLQDVGFDFVAPGDTPGAGGAGAGACAVDCVVFHWCPILGLVVVRDVVLCRLAFRGGQNQSFLQTMEMRK